MSLSVHADYAQGGFGGRIGVGKRPAVLIVDMQWDFVDPAAPTTCSPMAQERLPAIRRLLDAAREAGVPVIFTQGTVRPDLSDVGLWKGPHGAGMVQVEGTRGWQIVPELEPLESEVVIRKHRPSAFFGTELDALLKTLNADTIVLAGSSMSGCVRATTVDAFSRDYRTIVVSDCVVDRSPTILEANLIDVSAKYADAMNSAEAVEYLSAIDIQNWPELTGSVVARRVLEIAPQDMLSADVASSIAHSLNERFRRLRRSTETDSVDARLAAFTEFIRGILPSARFRVTRGRVFDSTGRIIDVPGLLIVDPSGAPSLPISSSAELVPAEAVYVSIDFLPKLDRRAIADAVCASAKLKGLRREPVMRGDLPVNDCSYVVMAMDGLAEDELLEAWAAANSTVEFQHQVDLVAVLGKGLATFVEADPGGAVTVELPVQPSARQRLSWLPSGSNTLAVAYLLIWETLRTRALRAPALHLLLSSLTRDPSRTLPIAYGVDRGE
jgi:maleamate amidohydrolase